jgi:hypothetical protein
LIFWWIDRGHEASPHIHALRPHSQGGGQLPTVGAPTGRNEGNLELGTRLSEEDPISDVLLPRVAPTVEAIHGNHVGACFHGRDSVPDSHALVDHLDAM